MVSTLCDWWMCFQISGCNFVYKWTTYTTSVVILYCINFNGNHKSYWFINRTSFAKVLGVFLFSEISNFESNRWIFLCLIYYFRDKQKHKLKLILQITWSCVLLHSTCHKCNKLYVLDNFLVFSSLFCVTVSMWRWHSKYCFRAGYLIHVCAFRHHKSENWENPQNCWKNTTTLLSSGCCNNFFIKFGVHDGMTHEFRIWNFITNLDFFFSIHCALKLFCEPF